MTALHTINVNHLQGSKLIPIIYIMLSIRTDLSLTRKNFLANASIKPPASIIITQFTDFNCYLISAGGRGNVHRIEKWLHF